jgi:DNA polymerase III subunit epsilon
VAFLEAEMARAGRPLPIPFYVDTLNLSRRALGLGRHSLEALREHFGLDRARSHRADADVAALREVFARVAALLRPETPRDLWDVRIAEKRAREHILAQCKEAIGARGGVMILHRPRGKAAQPLRMVVTAIDAEKEPPRVIGFELPGRGRRELRADRILRVEKADD